MPARGTLIWDFDGTLATRPFSWPDAFGEAISRLQPRHVVSRNEIVIELNTAFPWHLPGDQSIDRVDSRVWWSRMEEFFATIFVRLGFSEEAFRLAASVHELAASPDGYVLLPDAEQALIMAANDGWNQVILSNHMPDLPAYVTALGLDEYVSASFSSATMGYSKPHPMIFEKVKATLPPGRDLWMIGDSYEADIIGAMSAGIPGILVRTISGLHSHEAADLEEAVRIFSGHS